jgi:hypothetical protein
MNTLSVCEWANDFINSPNMNTLQYLVSTSRISIVDKYVTSVFASRQTTEGSLCNKTIFNT